MTPASGRPGLRRQQGLNFLGQFDPGVLPAQFPHPRQFLCHFQQALPEAVAYIRRPLALTQLAQDVSQASLPRDP